jgi:probable rRNA maturation factor
MIDVDNQTDSAFDFNRLQGIADALTDKEIELLITDNAAIQAINRDYRNIDAPTDVLSFPFDPVPMAPLGSIVISADKVSEAARTYGHAVDDELCLLFIHGMLHLMGYDHEADSGEMRLKEESIISQFNLPDSLIVRTER